MPSILSGLRVLDFGRYIAGPYCATLLGEYGAEVIRIEKRDGSEDRFFTPVGAQGDGATFLQLGRNKRSLTFDPMHAQAPQVMSRLVASADVVVANLPDATLKAMKLDYESLRAIKPNIILTTSNAYGPTGPMARHVGFDGIGQAMSGGVFMSGQPEQPYRALVPWVDFGTALHCAMATLAAIVERTQSGRGQHVQGSLLGTAVTMANAILIEQAVIKADRVATGNRAQLSGPTDIFRTRDGWMLVQVVGQPLFERWVKIIGEPHWLTDPRFANDELRGRNGEALSARMAQWCAQRSNDEVVALLGEAKIPCGAVLKPQETLDHPQVQAMGLLQPMSYPGLPIPAPVARMPVKMSVTEQVPLQRAPMLGEHTDEILQSLGFSGGQISEFRAAGLV